LVTGLALAEDLLARRRIGRGQQRREVRAFLGRWGRFAARLAGIDRIGLHDFLATVAGGRSVVEAFGRHLAEKEDQESPAQRAAGLGYRHRVEHVAPLCW